MSSFSDLRQLVGALSEVREALRKKSRERRYTERLPTSSTSSSSSRYTTSSSRRSGQKP
jgi:hypothetical protein